jgi:hypothetical protein
MRAQTGRAMVLAPGRQRRLVERIHRGAVLGQGDMQRLFQLAFGANPEIRLAADAEACRGETAFVSPGTSHHKSVAERRERPRVEGFGPFVIRYRKTDMIDHGWYFLSRAGHGGVRAKRGGRYSL